MSNFLRVGNNFVNLDHIASIEKVAGEGEEEKITLHLDTGRSLEVLGSDFDLVDSLDEIIVSVSPAEGLYAAYKGSEGRKNHLKPVTHIAVTAWGNIHYLVYDPAIDGGNFAKNVEGYSGIVQCPNVEAYRTEKALWEAEDHKE